MLQSEYDKLQNYPIEKEIIDRAYCNPMLKRDACPLSTTHDCSICFPKLQGAVTDIEVENPIPIIIWRLQKFAKGEADVWINEDKVCIKKDLFDKGENPFMKLQNQLENAYES